MYTVSLKRASSLPVNVVNIQTSRRIGARKGCAIRLRPETFEFLTTKMASDDDDAAAGRGGGKAEAERTAPGDDVVAGREGSMGDAMALAMAALAMRSA